jgi:hypothetical protein
MQNTNKRSTKLTVNASVSKYMSNLGKVGGKANTDKLKAEGLMDERIRKMTEASLRTRKLKKIIKQYTSTV